MRKTEIERTISFVFDCNDFLEMKREFKKLIKDLASNEYEDIQCIEGKLSSWFNKYFDTEYLPCKKCLFLPNEER